MTVHPRRDLGGAGQKWTSWRATWLGLHGALPAFQGQHPPRTLCCPGSKSAAGRPGHCAGKEEGWEATWTGFLQGPKGLATGGLRARGPEEFSRPLSQRGRQGDAISDMLTGSKSQTTEGQLCPALDSQAAGSAGPQHAANWEHRSPSRPCPTRTRDGVLGQSDGLPRASQCTDEGGELQRGWGHSWRRHTCPDPVLSSCPHSGPARTGTCQGDPAFQERAARAQTVTFTADSPYNSGRPVQGGLILKEGSCPCALALPATLGTGSPSSGSWAVTMSPLARPTEAHQKGAQAGPGVQGPGSPWAGSHGWLGL